MTYNNWLTINPTTGRGTGKATATIAGHSGYSTRSKAVTVSATVDGTNKVETITFTQEGTSIPGTGIIKLGDNIYEDDTIQFSDLILSPDVQFEINNTNARDFQYFIELVEGTMSGKHVYDILSAPSNITEIEDVKTGETVALTTFKYTNNTTSDNFRFDYSMDQDNLERKFGENQTYSIKINATPGRYSNLASQPLKVRYGLSVLTGATSTTPVELTSVVVEFPASTSFSVDVEGGSNVGPGATTKSIDITAPLDVNWSIQVSK